MGLIKKSNYEIKGINFNEVYVKITRLYIEKGNRAISYFGISNSRKNTEQPLQEICFECDIDKSINVYEQIYIKAKEELFSDFEDDIVEMSVENG